MATTEMLDVRREDLRNSMFDSPFWLTSGSVGVTADDLAAVLFSFPLTGANFRGRRIFLAQFIVEITTLWAGGTIAMTFGSCTLATDAVTTGGDTTDVDKDEYCLSADVTSGTVGVYGPTTGNTSDWLTARIANSYAAPNVITAADTTVPAIAAYITSDAAITGGALKVHALIESLPA